MSTNVSEQIGKLNEQITIYTQRNERHARAGFTGDLWSDEIRDCQNMIAKLRAGDGLTRNQRGLPL